MTTITKEHLVKHLFKTVGINKYDAKIIVDLFFQQISEALISGKEVKISSFGNFLLHDKAQREGRNPRTGESVPITARRVVTFKAGQKLKTNIDKTC